MKTRAPALRRAAQKPLLQAPAHAAKPAPRRAATIRKKTKDDASRMKAADRRRCVPGALPDRAARQFSPSHRAPSGTFATRKATRALTPPPPRVFLFLFFRFDDDRVIHGRSKTLMRHCRIGHRRGSFKDLTYRDRVNATLESVYGSTFREGEWWYRNPDENAFFARVFSMASGRDVSAAQAARVFVKNGETRKIDVDECAMRAAGVDVAEVAALYEKTPAAAWIAETRGERAAREAIVVPPLAAEARCARLEDVARVSASRATESSTSGASETNAETNGGGETGNEAPSAVTELARVSALARRPREASEDDDDDDDDATVVADEFDDDVAAFFEETDDALPALPAGGDPVTENHAPSVLPDSLGLGDLFASQPPHDAEAPRDFFFKRASSPARRETCAATRGGPGGETNETGAFVNDDDEDAAPFERLLTLGAVRKNMSFLGATAAGAVSARARSELETHLAHVDRILREQAPHDFSELLCSQGF